MGEPKQEASAPSTEVEKRPVAPTPGEVITSLGTGNSYTMGERIGEGSYGVLFACRDVWQNDLAAKVLKPIGTYESVKTMAEAEFAKLLQVRNPYITFVIVDPEVKTIFRRQ